MARRQVTPHRLATCLRCGPERGNALWNTSRSLQPRQLHCSGNFCVLCEFCSQLFSSFLSLTFIYVVVNYPRLLLHTLLSCVPVTKLGVFICWLPGHNKTWCCQMLTARRSQQNLVLSTIDCQKVTTKLGVFICWLPGDHNKTWCFHLLTATRPQENLVFSTVDCQEVTTKPTGSKIIKLFTTRICSAGHCGLAWVAKRVVH